MAVIDANHVLAINEKGAISGFKLRLSPDQVKLYDYIMQRFFLILIMLWLPLQGISVAAGSLCMHGENADGKLNTDTILITDDHLHAINHEQPMSNHISFDQECEANTLCHASCSVIIAAALFRAIPSNSSSYTVLLISKSISFIPEQLQRPPLV